MIGVKATGLDYAHSKLSVALKRLEEKSDLLTKLGRAGVAVTTQHFYDQRDPDGVAWVPLSPKTIKRKSGRTDRLLHKLDLINSITFTPLENGVFVHSSLPDKRVAPHQFGDPKRNIPKRAIFGASDELTEKIEAIATSHIGGLF